MQSTIIPDLSNLTIRRTVSIRPAARLIESMSGRCPIARIVILYAPGGTGPNVNPPWESVRTVGTTESPTPTPRRTHAWPTGARLQLDVIAPTSMPPESEAATPRGTSARSTALWSAVGVDVRRTQPTKLPRIARTQSVATVSSRVLAILTGQTAPLLARRAIFHLSCAAPECRMDQTTPASTLLESPSGRFGPSEPPLGRPKVSGLAYAPAFRFCA
jgi:hypothetical protein